MKLMQRMLIAAATGKSIQFVECVKNVLQEEMEILIKFCGQVQLLLYDTFYTLYIYDIR